jgi:Tfp pilus assembly protein PilO
MFAMLQDLARDKKKLAIAGVVTVALLYVDFSYVISSQIKVLKDLKAKIVSVRKDIETLNNDIKYVKTTTSKMVTLVTNKKLPLEKEIPSLLQDISAIANMNGIRIMQIDSTKEEAKAPQKGAASKPKKGERAAAQRESWSAMSAVKIKLDIIASYHKLGNFINEIENAEKLCIVDELSINRDSADPLKQSVRMVIKTYVKK